MNSCSGRTEPVNYTLYGYSLSLSDPCHPDELWFVKSYFQGNLVGNDTRKHGDTWDVAVNQSAQFTSEGETHSVTSDGWTVRSTINDGQAREVADSDTVGGYSLCQCDQKCTDSSANNYGQTGDCTYDSTCTDSLANNYGAIGSCTYDMTCTDYNANNYGSYGDCTYSNICWDYTAQNYGQEGDCFFPVDVPVYGCTDFSAMNYSVTANTDDGSCQYYDYNYNYGI
jgi:hypothetical protein